MGLTPPGGANRAVDSVPEQLFEAAYHGKLEGVRELLAEKDLNIRELRETVDILEIKIQKLEQLVRLKDSKIATLQAKMAQQQM